MKSKVALVLGLSVAIVLDTASQLLWKHIVGILPNLDRPLEFAAKALSEPLVIALIAIFLCQLINWLKVLEHADLSYAQPITSLSYISVCMVSAQLFNEHIAVPKVLGIACILFGVSLLSQSQSISTPAPL